MSIARWRARSLVALALCLIVGAALPADGAIRTQRVPFKKGADSAVVTGTIKGYETIDYLVTARKGQYANISLATRHGATYFNLMAPGQTEVAFFIGSQTENQFEGTLPADGEYRIRVYMMRSAARRNEVAPFRLEIAIGALGQASVAPASDAKVPGTRFHATGMLPCAMGAGQPTVQCLFGVQREGKGSSRVTVTAPDGRQTVIVFDQGRAVGYQRSPADGLPFSATREGDLNVIRIGDERYEVVDAVNFGG